eukprot:CAMPEP_0178954650 /NCGR_PEP_ID=MMETSP0789-20121207/9118_1 /TAXON_ID=3005 /ORGANISM="Rhizosolenia setigera, Strain CCMP 1694" /LENGTH=338 /DNA_ID=CAMNT_0020636095 /DNA_START=522 /DNA_END=1538 /DNA_ORIENTATION=+
MVPRSSNVLEEWGIMKTSDDIPSSFDDETSFVEVELTCPRSAINSELNFTGNGFGFKKFETCALGDLKLSPSSPILLHSHGGGFVIGGVRDLCAYLAYSLTTTQQVKEKNGIILLSVNYRLAPENPFPACVIDCISVADFVIKNFSKSDLHISGFSAGGNLASVVGMEIVRKFPGKLKSIVAINPCVNPRSKSISIHMNWVSSYTCPGKWFVWLWAAYLQLGEFHDYNSFIEKLQEHDLFKELGDEKSTKSNILRMIQPQMDLPIKELRSNLAPKIFVINGTADPLCNDGEELVDCLINKQVTNVKSYHLFGSHGCCLFFDFIAFRKFNKAWSEVVWQ